MNLDNFTNRAEAYAKGRPGYPQEAIDKILEFASKETVFADIGAGTGKFTKELAKQGHFIYAVEPNADMRGQLILTMKPYTNVKVYEGTAEKTTLPDQSVDILTVAHALHWFDLDTFRAECHRIVKPGGLVIVIYNHVPGKEMADFCRRAVDAFFTEPKIWTFENPINYTKDEWIAYIQSQDDSPLPGDSGYDAHIDALNEQFERESIHGLLRCDRVTGIYCQGIDEIRR